MNNIVAALYCNFLFFEKYRYNKVVYLMSSVEFATYNRILLKYYLGKYNEQ